MELLLYISSNTYETNEASLRFYRKLEWLDPNKVKQKVMSKT